MVGQTPSRVRDVSRHEGDQPSGENACSFAEVILGHAGNREDGQGAVNSRETEHAPPNSLVRGGDEGLQNHGTYGHGPREQRRSRVDAADGVEPVSVNDEVSVVGENVVNNPLHVPGVGAASHVPVLCTKTVHRRHGVPLNSNGETDKERHDDHEASAVGTHEEPGLRWLVLASVGPPTVIFVVADGIDTDADEERDGEPNQSTPCAVEVFVVPNA